MSEAQVRRPKFERHPSRIVFDPRSSSFVATWSKCDMAPEERILRKKPLSSVMPSVSAMATLYDRGCIPQSQTVYAARAVGRAWAAGDRCMLDTEEARKAAELVADLSSMGVDESSESVAVDFGQALRHLSDEMAASRFMSLSRDDLSDSRVMPAMERSVAECLGVEGFASWSPPSMRRRFLQCMKHREVTEVTYTLAALLFNCGACPLLSMHDRRIVRVQYFGKSDSPDMDRAVPFFRFVLDKMRAMKDSGLSRTGEEITQQQLSDDVGSAMDASAAGKNEKKENK